MIIFKIFILLSFCMVCHSQSPCPGFFQYMIDSRTRKIYGRVMIPHVPQNVVLHLRITFSIKTILPSYVGKLELARSRKDSIKAIKKGLPIIYNISFPVSRPLPQLLEIKFNNWQYCIGEPVYASIWTNFFFEHFLRPAMIIFPNDKPRNILTPSNIIKPPKLPVLEDDNAKFTFNISSSTSRPFLSTSITNSNDNRIFSESSFNENCGKPGKSNNYMIANELKTLPDQWPWLVAIFVTQEKLKFQCAGSLITDRHVLTAAHCIRMKGRELSANNFLVSVNLYHLDDWREENVQNSEVLEIRIHPEYKSYESAHADLALLILRDKLRMNSAIQPICLWYGPTNLETVVGYSGYVVGWGRDESGYQHSAEPRIAQVPIVSQEDCLRSNIGFISSTSNKTFCAGYRDGTGPCNGDSGSALVIFNPFSGRYHLRGIVSLSLLDRETLSCDLTQYVVYVDAAKYVDWIKVEISST